MEVFDKPYSFISYSHEDADKVIPIIERLTKEGYRCWYDKEIDPGVRWEDKIATKIADKNCVKFIVFISHNSLDSEHIKDEINFSKSHKKSILVVYLEEITLTVGLELSLSRFQYLNWDFNNYELSFKKLLKGMPNETNEPPEEKYIDTTFTERYELISKIGQGGTSSVYLAKMYSTQSNVVIKIYNSTDSLYTNERNKLALINCPFVPKIIDFGSMYYQDSERYYLVESVVNTDFNYDQITCTEKNLMNILLKIANILQYLQMYQIVHCDIKPSNIRMDSFENVYLLDFSAAVQSNTPCNSYTPLYAAPEQDCQQEVDFTTDIYCLGTTIKYLMLKAYRANITKDKLDSTDSIQCFIPDLNPLFGMYLDKMTDEKMDKRFQSLEDLIETGKKILPHLSDKVMERWVPTMDQDDFTEGDTGLFDETTNITQLEDDYTVIME